MTTTTTAAVVVVLRTFQVRSSFATSLFQVVHSLFYSDVCFSLMEMLLWFGRERERERERETFAGEDEARNCFCSFT
jgi:hypothetical protein